MPRIPRSSLEDDDGLEDDTLVHVRRGTRGTRSRYEEELDVNTVVAGYIEAEDGPYVPEYTLWCLLVGEPAAPAAATKRSSTSIRSSQVI